MQHFCVSGQGFFHCYGRYLFGDVTIFIDIVQVESPSQFLCYRASEQDRQSNHKILWKKKNYFYLFLDTT